MNGAVPLTSFLVCLSLYEKGTGVLSVDFVSCYFDEHLYKLEEFPGAVFHVENIICQFFLGHSYPITLLQLVVLTSSTTVNLYGERGYLCLLPDFSGKASGFSLFAC